MINHIQSRRDALSAQMEQAKQQYDQLEAALAALDRQLCAMAGGLQELDALLEEMQHAQEDQQPQRGQPDQPDYDPQTDHNDS